MINSRCERIISERGSGSVFLVDKKIALAREEFDRWDACQGRPMGRCPSVQLRLFTHFSSITRKIVRIQRNLYLHCIPDCSLPLNLTRIAVSSHVSLIILEQIYQIASTRVGFLDTLLSKNFFPLIIQNYSLIDSSITM